MSRLNLGNQPRDIFWVIGEYLVHEYNPAMKFTGRDEKAGRYLVSCSHPHSSACIAPQFKSAHA